MSDEEISPAQFSDYLESKGAERPCEACGHNDWSPVILGPNMATAVITAGNSAAETYMMICSKCGHMRFFFAPSVLKDIDDGRRV